MKPLRAFSAPEKDDGLHRSLEDIVRNYKSVTNQQDRLSLLVDKTMGVFMDPSRADLVSDIGDLSAHVALPRI